LSPIERIKLSQQAREQLSRLKRHTGVEHWNTLCRWGFCRSLADQDPPPLAKIPGDSNVELTWSVFGGRYERIYLALLKERCLRDGLGTDDETLAIQFRLHLHRGIAQLAGDRTQRDLASFLARAMPSKSEGTSIGDDSLVASSTLT
jgi:DNA sulfur modification protein DndE